MPFKYRCLLLISPGLFLLDQWTKHLVRLHIPRGGALALVPGCFDLVHVLNTGAAFGILAGPHAGWRTPFFLIVSVAAVAGIGYLLRGLATRERFLPVILALVVGAIFGNLVDRLRFGAVTDFLSIYWHTWSWPAFNVADSAITVSMLLLGYRMLRTR